MLLNFQHGLVLTDVNRFKFLLYSLFFVAVTLGGLTACGGQANSVTADRTATVIAVVTRDAPATVQAIATDVDASGISTSLATGNQYAATGTALASLPTVTPKPTQIRPTAARSTPTAPLPPHTNSTVTASAIITFSVVPTTTRALGDKIQVAWQTRLGQVTLCPFLTTPQGPVEMTGACSSVPAEGNQSITIGESDLGWTGLLLRVTDGQTIERSLIPLTFGCQGFRDWFFTPAPTKCPQAVALNSPAAAQTFEHGLMLWTKNPDTFYVLDDTDKQSGTFEFVNAPYTFNTGASPDNRMGETPPAGLFEPVSGFGQLWRGELQGLESVRPRLGWETAPEKAFDSHYQCELPNPSFALWTCYLNRPDGKILRLHPDSTAQVHFLWDVK